MRVDKKGFTGGAGTGAYMRSGGQKRKSTTERVQKKEGVEGEGVTGKRRNGTMRVCDAGHWKRLWAGYDRGSGKRRLKRAQKKGGVEGKGWQGRKGKGQYVCVRQSMAEGRGKNR